jgi:hypothetical protein
MNERTVVRGGGGIYFGTTITGHFTKLTADTIQASVVNDGRPDFASNPWNGPEPTYEQILARVCTPALVPGCITREAVSSGYVHGPNFHMPYSYQSSIGIQRQIGQTMAVDVDYVYNGNRDVGRDVPINLTYNPATGANYPWTDVSRRPFPHWGQVSVTINEGQRANSHALQTAFTKRFSNRWQANGTYTLGAIWDADPIFPSGLEPVPFPLAPDFGGEYTLAAGDQRHRATLNGIWELPYNFQLSGLYFFGSGERRDTHWGVDLRNVGGGARASEVRLRPDGTLVPRNNFVGKPVHRVDVRFQRRFALGSRAGIDGILEVFNAFNHANYGSYNTNEVSSTYGEPAQNLNIAYAPRTLQLGFRVTF